MTQHDSTRKPQPRKRAHPAAHSAGKHERAAHGGPASPAGPRKHGTASHSAHAHHAVGSARRKPPVLACGAAALALGVLALVFALVPGAPRIAGLVLGVLALCAAALGLVHTAAALATPRAADMRTRVAIACIAAAVLALVAIVLCIVLLASGGASNGKAALACGDKAIEAALDPSDELRASMSAAIAETAQDSGLDLDAMGVSADDIVTWMLEDTSYERVTTDVTADDGTVTLLYEVRANNVGTLFETADDAMDDLDYDSITSMSEAYEKIGHIMLIKMETGGTTVQLVEVELEHTSGGWAVETDDETLIDEMFFG